MSIAACAQIVFNRDPDRFAAIMSAPLADREKLFVLLAFHLEVAKAPWVTKEAMIAEMRLQFWHDVVDEACAGKDPKAHEVASPLADLIRAMNLPAEPFHQMITARRWDIYSEPHQDDAALARYLRDTGGALLSLAVQALGGQATPELEQYGADQALAAYFQAIPALENAQKRPLVDGRPEAVRDLAQDALERMKRFDGSSSPKSALRMGYQAVPLLKRVLKQPELVVQDALKLSEFHKKSRLLWLSLRGGY